MYVKIFYDIAAEFEKIVGDTLPRIYWDNGGLWGSIAYTDKGTEGTLNKKETKKKKEEEVEEEGVSQYYLVSKVDKSKCIWKKKFIPFYQFSLFMTLKNFSRCRLVITPTFFHKNKDPKCVRTLDRRLDRLDLNII